MNSEEIARLSVYKLSVTRQIYNSSTELRVLIRNREDIKYQDEVYVFTKKDLNKLISDDKKSLKKLVAEEVRRQLK